MSEGQSKKNGQAYHSNEATQDTTTFISKPHSSIPGLIESRSNVYYVYTVERGWKRSHAETWRFGWLKEAQEAYMYRGCNTHDDDTIYFTV